MPAVYLTFSHGDRHNAGKLVASAAPGPVPPASSGHGPAVYQDVTAASAVHGPYKPAVAAAGFFAWRYADAADSAPAQRFVAVCADRVKSIYRWSSPGATAGAPESVDDAVAAVALPADSEFAAPASAASLIRPLRSGSAHASRRQNQQ